MSRNTTSPVTDDDPLTDQPIPFAELNCLSNYSFLQGASHPEELVHQAATLGYAGLALTDECSVAGIVKAWQAARQHPELQLVVGSEFRHASGRFILLAPDKAGYAELCTLITRCRRQASKGDYHFEPEWLLDDCHRCLLLWSPAPVLSARPPSDLSRPPPRDHVPDVPDTPDVCDVLDAYDDKRLKLAHALKHHFHHRLWLLSCLLLLPEDSSNLQFIESLAQQLEAPVVASSRVLMHCSQRKRLQDCLTAIRHNSSVREIRGQLHPNAENHLRPLRKLARLYSRTSLLESLNILQRCTFRMEELAYRYPREVVPPHVSPSAHLRQLTYAGALKRYKVAAPEALPPRLVQQLEKELAIIGELAYEYYFLTIHDIVDYACQQGILCQGRGSAANSAVCYCLGITAVDPLRVSLLFERFISRRRNEPPDIDVDFENERREEVIQYLYRKYGRDRCAIAATVIRYRPKSAIRDLGKALGVDLAALENVIANYGWRYRGKDWINEVISEGVSRDSHLLSSFRNLLQELLGFPRHLSQHVGGFVITEGLLTDIVPVENTSMPDRTVIQWDKDDLEALGLMKVDILALGMLTAIRKTMALISTRQGAPFGMTDIPVEDDPQVYRMLQQADSVGLFQVESRAQMNMLPRLRPEKYYDLVVQVAIVRPGPIHGDMVHPYLRRKAGLEPPDVPLPELQPILSRTFGVPIFQEQVIAMSMAAAGFSADEAEELRRSMASWKKHGHMHQLRDKMMNRLLKRGVTEEYVERICRQIEGFGEYGFPESHAASFAQLAYVSAWLKYYYPAEFFCGLLNSQPMGFYQPWQLIQDARRHGVNILPVNLNQSHWDHHVVWNPPATALRPTLSEDTRMIESTDASATRLPPGALRLGFRCVSGLSRCVADILVSHRPAAGYHEFSEVSRLPGVDRQSLERLASADAFACLGGHRYQQRWQVAGKGFYAHLFEVQEDDNITPYLPSPSRLDEILESFDSTGVVLDDHPIALLRDEGKLADCITAEEIGKLQQDQEIYVAGVVVNRQRPGTASGVTFVTLEDETGSINLVIWLKTALQQMETLVKSRLLKVYGKVDKDENGKVIHVIVYKLFNITPLLKRLQTSSRDFH